VEPGVYVAGWIKRGPTGFIGTNKSCAEETVTAILDDLDRGLPDPVGTPESIAAVVRGRCPDVVDLDGWRRIDAEELARGAAAGRAREKIVDAAEQAAVARPPAVRRRRGSDLVRGASP
jgi:ferredoxin--NADP+ reductase